MAEYLFQIYQTFDSVLPRDRIVNTVAFDDHGVTSDPSGLCADLCEAWDTIWTVAATVETHAWCYPVGAPPNEPVGHAIRNEGLVLPASAPRELAVCMSFYAEENRPRRRGRCYLPYVGTGSGPGGRPGSFLLDMACDLGEALAGIGGADVDWCVYSRRENELYPVTHVWCDNEWDTVRSRGLRATDRQTRAVGA